MRVVERRNLARLGRAMKIIGFVWALIFLTVVLRDRAPSTSDQRVAQANQPGLNQVTLPGPSDVTSDQPRARPAPQPQTRPVRIANPLPTLLADRTLRRGDIVVFPDGPRVFTGRAGSRHEVSDFIRSSDADVANPTRKALAAMRVGANDAWSFDLTPRRVALNESKPIKPASEPGDCQVRVRSPGQPVRCYEFAER